MRTIALAALGALLVTIGVAYGQNGPPWPPVQANRITMGIGPALKDASFQADSAWFEDGAMHLSGRVRITERGHVMTADVAVIGAYPTTSIKFEGHPSVDQPAAR